ncbi:unnamed protein product [Scytosiphon promiscuus]
MLLFHASPAPERLAPKEEVEREEAHRERASGRLRRHRRRQRAGSSSGTCCSMRSAKPAFSVATMAAAAAAAVAVLGPLVGATDSSCEYERVTEQDGGSFEVPINVGHTFDVPAADSQCPQGYGGIVIDLTVEEGALTALFLQIDDGFDSFSTLDDHGPTLAYSDQDTSITNVHLEEGGVYNVAGYEPADSGDGAYDLGMTFGGDDVCSSSESGLLRQVGVKIVGCGFTLADLVFQRISVVTSCLGDDMETDVGTVGFGGSVPSSCDEEEVLEASVLAAGSSSGSGITSGSGTTINSGSGGSSQGYGGSGSGSGSGSTSGSSGIGHAASGGSDSASVTSTTAGSSVCSELSNAVDAAGATAFIAISEDDPLSFTTSTDNCEYRTITVIFDTWPGSTIKAAFFDLEVNQDKMSSIDGFDSGSSGFDFAIAFEGESDVVEVDLRGCGLTVDSFAGNRANMVLAGSGNTYTLAKPSLECIVESSRTSLLGDCTTVSQGWLSHWAHPSPLPCFNSFDSPFGSSMPCPITLSLNPLIHHPSIRAVVPMDPASLLKHPSLSLPPSLSTLVSPILSSHQAPTSFNSTSSPSASPTAFSTATPTGSLSPTAVPTAAPSSMPTMTSDLGGNVIGTLTVRGGVR